MGDSVREVGLLVECLPSMNAWVPPQHHTVMWWYMPVILAMQKVDEKIRSSRSSLAT